MSIQTYQNYKLSNNFIIDFNKLAILQPQLHNHVHILNDRVVWNFKSQAQLILLTRSIMKYIFNYKWDCPINNLCPRIPSRVNYILWLRWQIKDKIEVVLDIGTGATLIYPLIGVKMYNWRFIATEIDEQSYNHSSQLIRINNLTSMIDLRLVPKSSQPQDQYIISNIIKLQEQISLTICNPPFFNQQSQTISTMTQKEHHAQDGQYGFFFNLYRQSYRYKNIKYFSMLIGRLTNFKDIKKFLIEEDAIEMLEMVKFGQIQQGNNIRFIVLWKINHQN